MAEKNQHDTTVDGRRPYDPSKIVKPQDPGGKPSGGKDQGGGGKKK